jgi:hypothetical protein
VSEQKIYGPFFFAEIRITGMLKNWLWPQLLQDILQELRFQQDEVPPHYHLATWQFLKQLSESQRGQAGPIPWPLWSSNLKPLHFYLLGYVKEHVNIPPLPETH